MALPVTNNNEAKPITANGTYCTLQVPGAIPPQIAGASGSSPQFAAASYHIVAGSSGAGTTITFEALSADGVWRALVSPAPITATNGATYNSTLSGTFGALRLNVSALAGNGLAYAQLSGAPASGYTSPNAQIPLAQFQSGATTTQLYIDPVGGDLIAKALTGPNSGKTVNLTYGKWA